LGVKVLLWKTSSELNTLSQRATFFQQLQAYGVDGMKVDFFDFSSASAAARERVQLRQSILQEAAGYHLVTSFHGTPKPTGEFRTYPNLIQTEGIFGKEQYPNPWMVATVPFMRFLAGPGDYTPLDFGGNIAFEIANVVNMPGPIITYCERSDQMANSPFASLIRTIPSQWDETVALSQSQLGQTTATARRKGQDWYIGIMNTTVTNNWSIPLTFLDANVTYQADIVRQDSTALERTNVTRNSTFSVSITSTNGSGFVAKIYPIPDLTTVSNYLLNGLAIGTSGSFGNSGNTLAHVFDGNLTTFFDGPDASGDWAGLDLGVTNQKIVTMIRYCPRATWGGRMVGGQFQGANSADFSNAVTLWTVGYFPPDGSLTTVTLTNRTAFRYVRYLSPANGWCNLAEAQFFGSTNPPAPAGLAASSGSNQVMLNWDAVTNTVYNVSNSTNSSGPYVAIATNLFAPAFTNTDLLGGQTYYYVVSAVNPVGLASPNSVVASATPSGLPQIPNGVMATPGTNATVMLTWGTVLNVTGYNVKRSLVRGGPYFIVGTPTTSAYTDDGLANGVTYFYVVTALNAQGESANSPEVAVAPGESTAWTRTASPLGYWRLNESSGIIAADSSGNGLDGTYEPAVALGVPGVANPPYFGFATSDLAASFNGQANSWVSLPPLNLNSATATFAAWIDPTVATQAGATGLIFCRDGLSTVSGFGYNPAGTQLGYTWNNDSGTYGWNSGLTPPVNQWSFVALVVTPTSATVYLYNTNGAVSASTTHTQTASAFSGETRIGNDSLGSNRTFQGSLCEAAVFNTALTSNQIAALYQGAVGAFSNPALASTWNNQQLTLAWPDNGLLLQTTNLTGPWTTNLGAASPLIMTPIGASKFFRLQLR
jgi:hypothetical protein